MNIMTYVLLSLIAVIITAVESYFIHNKILLEEKKARGFVSAGKYEALMSAVVIAGVLVIVNTSLVFWLLL